MQYKKFFTISKQKGITNIQITETSSNNINIDTRNGKLSDYDISDTTDYSIKAEVVRMIFDMYLSGMGYKSIAKKLTGMNIPTARQDEIVRRETMGRSTSLKSSNCWSIVSVSDILRNDFYIALPCCRS